MRDNETTNNEKYEEDMGSVISKNGFSALSSQTNKLDSREPLNESKSDMKSSNNSENDVVCGNNWDYGACFTSWSDDVTYKYLDDILCDDLEYNIVPGFNSYAQTNADICSDLEDSCENIPSSNLASEKQKLQSISDSTNSCLEEEKQQHQRDSEDNSFLDLENQILQEYNDAKGTRPLLSEVNITKLFFFLNI